MSLVNNNSLPIVPYVSKSAAMNQSQLSVNEYLKSCIKKILEDSFKAQLRDYNHFHQYGMGDIVVLAGTSTAGKTSIIKALKLLEPDRLEDGVDLRCHAIDLKIMIKFNPDETEILRKSMQTSLDITKAVFSTERSWKTEITPQEKIEAEAAIQRIKEKNDSFSSEEKEYIDGLFLNMKLEMFDDAFEYSRRGGNIIFDVLIIDAFARHLLTRNFNGPIRTVLTYCPFHALSARMEKRNKEAVENGELSNQRIGEFPLMQFSEIYTQKEKGQVAFERITRAEATQAFDANFDKGIEAKGNVSLSTEQLIEKEKLRVAFLANLGFKEGTDAVEVAPRNQQHYSLFINSNEVLPNESAQLIHAGTHRRYNSRI